jgi:hypothetical protein
LVSRADRRLGARLFGRFRRVASVPAIMRIHGTIESDPWIFIHTIVSPGRPLVPRSAQMAVMLYMLIRCVTGRY